MKLFVLVCAVILFVNQDYPSFDINNMTWMKSNLTITTFQNGDTIMEAKTAGEWESALKNKTPAFCYYDNDKLNGKKYGYLYNFYAVNDERGLAPEGWHVSTDKEWEALIDFYGGVQKAAIYLIKGEFQLVPSGFRTVEGGFNGKENSVLYWTSTIHFNFLSFNRQIFVDENTSITRGSSHHAMGMYVRCVKN